MKVNEKIEAWYEENKRDLVFRNTRDPYAIWVSEIMAQQTRIDTMIPYYIKWMHKWPTIEALSRADIQDVLHLWQGLGYYNRARKLHQGACTIMDKFKGIFPSNYEELIQIDGIGEYTAGAILSVCFEKEQPAVDGNVFRVVTRYMALSDDIMKTQTKRDVTAICAGWMKNCNPSQFTQGLMELGAVICVPKNPRCAECPLCDQCKGFKMKKQEEYPVKSKAKKPLELEVHTYVLLRGDELYISMDDSDGLMKDYIRLPQFSTPLTLDCVQLKKRKHIFSHRIWNMNCYYKEDCKELKLDQCKWVKLSEVKDIPMATAHKKLLGSVLEKHRLA